MGCLFIFLVACSGVLVGLGVLVKTGNEGITALGVADGSVDGVAEGANVAPGIVCNGQN